MVLEQVKGAKIQNLTFKIHHPDQILTPEAKEVCAEDHRKYI